MLSPTAVLVIVFLALALVIIAYSKDVERRYKPKYKAGFRTPGHLQAWHALQDRIDSNRKAGK